MTGDPRAHLPWRIAHRLGVEAPPEGLEGPCLLWRGAWTTGNGYGKVSWEGRHRVVHRVVYELETGVRLPRLVLLDHLCRRRGCCQTLHLEPVTTRENTLRGNAVLFRKAEVAPRVQEEEGVDQLGGALA